MRIVRKVDLSSLTGHQGSDISYSEIADAYYFSIHPYAIHDTTITTDHGVNIDLDQDGRVIGVEILA